MTAFGDSRSELLDLVARLRHLHSEHVRAGVGGAVRRKLDADMQEVSEHLERRLASLLGDESDRAAWREHAHHGGPAPERPVAGEGASAEAEATPPDRPSGRRPWPR